MSSSENVSVYGIAKRVYALLNRRERRRTLLMLGGVLANSFVDILGLAVVVPVIGLVVDRSLIHNNAYLSAAFGWSQRWLGLADDVQFLILLSSLMAGGFFFKAFFGMVVALYQARFSMAVAHRLQGQMWDYHFSTSFAQLHSMESGKILTEISNWPIYFATHVLVGLLALLTEAVVVGLIIIGLLAYDAMAFGGVGLILFVGTIIIRKVTKRRLAHYSATQKTILPRVNTLLTNAIRGFIELISFQAVGKVKTSFLKDTRRLFRVHGNTTVLQAMPVRLYEALAVTSVAGAIVLGLLIDPTVNSFSTLTLLALSAYRVMPAMSRLNGRIITIRGQNYLMDAIEEAAHSQEVKGSYTGPEDVQPQAPMGFVLQSVELRYGEDTPVFTDFSAAFKSGQMIAIVGGSGSGKSTLVSALMGLHPASQGEVMLCDAQGRSYTLGRDISHSDWLRCTSYLSQHPFLFNGTVWANLTLGLSEAPFTEEKALALVEQLELTSCLGDEPLGFELLAGGSNLSGGQMQRLALLRALLHKRPVLILDEATSALDLKLRDTVHNLLRAEADQGVTVLLVTHDGALAERCDEILEVQL